MGMMAAEATAADLRERANRALAELATLRGGGSYVWVVVHEGGDKIGGCSHNLRPYQEAFEDEVALAMPMEITATGTSLPDAEATFAQRTKTKHTDLHPIVAVLMAKLNEINGHNSPRTMAISHPDTLPPWFPHHPRVYAERAQAMSVPQLFQVLDAIFRHVRRHVAAIDALHAALAAHFRGSSVPTRTRACFEAFFDFLKRETEEAGRKPRGGRGTTRAWAPSPSVAAPQEEKAAASNGPTGASPRGREPGARRRRGLRNSPKIEPGELFLPSPGPHPSEQLDELEEDTPILDSPKPFVKRGRRARLGDQVAGGAETPSPEDGQSAFTSAAANGLAKRGRGGSAKRGRPKHESAEARSAYKKSRVKIEWTDALDESEASERLSTPRGDASVTETACLEARRGFLLEPNGFHAPEAESSGEMADEDSRRIAAQECENTAGEDLDGKGWGEDADSEQSFDELLNDVDWELVSFGLRAEANGNERTGTGRNGVGG